MIFFFFIIFIMIINKDMKIIYSDHASRVHDGDQKLVLLERWFSVRFYNILIYSSSFYRLLDSSFYIQHFCTIFIKLGFRMKASSWDTASLCKNPSHYPSFSFGAWFSSILFLLIFCPTFVHYIVFFVQKWKLLETSSSESCCHA